MVERKKELRRRYSRKRKMAKLKKKLRMTDNPTDRDAIIEKIQFLSPWWKEPAKSEA